LSYGGNTFVVKNTSNWFDFWNCWKSCSVQSLHRFQYLKCFLCVSSSEAAWNVFSIALILPESLQVACGSAKNNRLGYRFKSNDNLKPHAKYCIVFV